MRFSIILVFFSLAFPLVTIAQDEQEVPYTKETGIGINFNTNGGLIGGIALKHSRYIKKSSYHLFAFEAVNVKHSKEQRVAAAKTSNTFILNKVNYLFSLRPMYGREFLLFRKSEEEGIRISGLIAAGPSIGILKPYAIQYDITPNANANSNPDIIVNEPYDPSKHTSPDLILGTGGFLTGINKSKIFPGISAKAALSFEIGNAATGVEVGGLVEYYPKGKERVIYNGAPNPAVYTSLYINIYFAFRD